MKTTILFLLLIGTICNAQLNRPTASTGTSGASSAVSDSVKHLSNQSINYSIDSTSLVFYGSRFEKLWFYTGTDSLAVDTLRGVIKGAGTETMSFRIIWGVNADTPQDSCTDLEVSSFTSGTKAASTKIIPSYRYVWIKVTALTGTPECATLTLQTRRKY